MNRNLRYLSCTIISPKVYTLVLWYFLLLFVLFHRGTSATKKTGKSALPVADDSKDVSMFFTCMHFSQVLPDKYPSMSVCRFKTSFPCYLVGISKKLRSKLNQQIPCHPLSSTQTNRLGHGELLRSHHINLNGY